MVYNSAFSWFDPSSVGRLTDPTNQNANVLKKTIDVSFKPTEQNALSNLNRRGFGFGSDLYSPTIQAGTFAPIANQKSTALTDLWFKNESNNRAWNQDKRTGMLAEVNYGATEDARARQGRSQAAKVLCTELVRQGLLKDKYLKADLRFLAQYVPAETHCQYLAWATPLSYKMKESKLITAIVFIPVFFWNMYMYRTVIKDRLGVLGTIGKLVHKCGVQYGKFYAGKMQKAVA